MYISVNHRCIFQLIIAVHSAMVNVVVIVQPNEQETIYLQ